MNEAEVCLFKVELPVLCEHRYSKTCQKARSICKPSLRTGGMAGPKAHCFKFSFTIPLTMILSSECFRFECLSQARSFTCCLAQVERQIDQMVRFIKQEAEEKANEIGISAEEVHCCLCCSYASALLGFAASWTHSKALAFCRNSTSRSCNYWRPKRERSRRTMSDVRAKLKLRRRCESLKSGHNCRSGLTADAR